MSVSFGCDKVELRLELKMIQDKGFITSAWIYLPLVSANQNCFRMSCKPGSSTISAACFGLTHLRVRSAASGKSSSK